MDKEQQDQLKLLPQVQKLLDSETGQALSGTYSHARVVDALRESLDALRSEIRAGAVDDARLTETTILGEIESRLALQSLPSLRHVINATGIVIHTNLGRAPLADAAIENMTQMARYSNLEFDLVTGKRGSRYTHVEQLLYELTGAEASVVVNNNAAAVMLVLNTMAMDAEVIISRGELIEIGGSFRIPDVITRSGGTLVEVGATNKTHLVDYENAITENSAALMKVHPSNFRMLGFTGEASRQELVQLAKQKKLTVIEDLGSGTLVDLTRWGLPHEDTVKEVLDAGVDVVTFSGDKLLGGPQAGIICGKKDFIDQMKKNPLIRGLRIDKLSLAALEATLRLYQNDDTLRERLPVVRLLTQGIDELGERATALAAKLNAIDGLSAETADSESFSGGGALPAQQIPTKIVRVEVQGLSANRVAELLRSQVPPVVGRIADDAFTVDVRTVFDEDFETLTDALGALRP